MNTIVVIMIFGYVKRTCYCKNWVAIKHCRYLYLIISDSISLSKHLNQFIGTGFFLYTLEVLENLRFSVFKGHRRTPVREMG